MCLLMTAQSRHFGPSGTGWNSIASRKQVVAGPCTRLYFQGTCMETALEAHHNHTTASHRGVNKTGSNKGTILLARFDSQFKKWVRVCHDCGAKKNWGKKRRSALQQYVVGAPMERLAMDILRPLPQTPRGNKFILVVTDYFTKWTESYAIPNQEATTVAEKLVSEFVCRFGVPREIHSDQGSNFESKVMTEVCKLLDIEKTRTPRPYILSQTVKWNDSIEHWLKCFEASLKTVRRIGTYNSNHV